MQDRQRTVPMYNVKRGLRNEDGTGVLVGLTKVGNAVGYERLPEWRTESDPWKTAFTADTMWKTSHTG